MVRRRVQDLGFVAFVRIRSARLVRAETIIRADARGYQQTPEAIQQ
jgi:hypothetical protein